MTQHETDLLDYCGIVWKSRWLVTGIVFAAMVSACVVLYYTPNTYLAEASLLLMDQDKGALSMTSIGGFSLPGIGNNNSIDKLLVILDSKTIARQVVGRLNLVSQNKKSESRFDIADYIPILKKKAAVRAGVAPKEIILNKTVDYLQKQTSFSSSDGGLVRINVEWTDPNMATEIVSTYISVVSVFMNDNSIGINFKVIDPAQPPTDKYSPQVKKTLIFSFLSSLLGSILLVFIKNAITHRV